MPEVEALGDQACTVRQRRRVDPFQRQHFFGGAIPIHRGDAEIRIVLGVLGHFRERGGLQPKVHFDRDRAPQGVDHFDETQPPRLGGKVLGVVRDIIEGAEVGVEPPFDTGAQQLDRDRARTAGAEDFSTVHLRNRGGGDRRPEAREN